METLAGIVLAILYVALGLLGLVGVIMAAAMLRHAWRQFRKT